MRGETHSEHSTLIGAEIARKYGALVVRKPFDIDHLVQTIRTAAKHSPEPDPVDA